jgi:hypothetical protein
MERTNGQIVLVKPYLDNINWTKGIDPKTGKPVDYPIPARRPGKMASVEEVARSQSFQGASAGAAAGNVTYRATAGAKPRQGNSRFLLVADRKIDARSQAQDSPRRTSGHAAQIRGSEHDHRRLKASPPFQ